VHIRNTQFTLSDDHLMELGQALLAFVTLELRPELEVLINDFERLHVVFR